MIRSRVLARALLTAVIALAVTGGLALRGGRAEAYPQWQFSSGSSRCSQCHFSPDGGGIVTSHARDAVGEDLSTWEGNGAFLHGAVDLPKALALQFDGRYAVMSQNVGEQQGSQLFYFPMQADLSGRLALTDSISVVAVLGYRGQAREGDLAGGEGAPTPEPGSRFISREHYVMWKPDATGPYVRIGRFFAPYGLRLAEHTTYVRRDLGFNTLEETYNVSGGVVKDNWELHLTAFGPDVLRYLGSRQYGAAGMLELRLGTASALGVDGRAGLTKDMYQYTGGLFGKSYFDSVKTLIQAQVDMVYSTFPGGTTKTDGFVGYVGLTFFPSRGIWVTPFAERKQTSIAVKDTATNGGGLQLNWFPYPHFEVTGLVQYQDATGGNTALTSMLFVHYYM